MGGEERIYQLEYKSPSSMRCEMLVSTGLHSGEAEQGQEGVAQSFDLIKLCGLSRYLLERKSGRI